MNKKSRRHFTAAQKAEILRRHLFDKVPVSDLAEEYNLQPSVIYGWERQLRVNMELALEKEAKIKRTSNRERQLKAKIDSLEAKLTKKDAVIAEVTEEFVTLKKQAGEP